MQQLYLAVLVDPVVLLTPPLKNESSFSNNSSFFYMLIGVNGKIRKLYKELDRLNREFISNFIIIKMFLMFDFDIFSATFHTVEQ